MCIATVLFATGNLLATAGETLFVYFPNIVFRIFFGICNLIPIFNMVFTIPIAIINFLWTWLPAFLATATLCISEAMAAVLLIAAVIAFAKRRSAWGAVCASALTLTMLVKLLLDAWEFLVVYVVDPLLTVVGPSVMLIIGDSIAA